MNRIRKSILESIKWQHMPLLRTLVLVQIGIAIIFSIIATIVAIYFVNERSTSLVNLRKLDLIRIMTPNQEKIRLWANLEMDEALTLTLKDTKKIDFVKALDVKRLSEAQFLNLKKDKHTLLIPEKVDHNLPFYLVFKLNQATNASILSTLLIPLIVFLFTFTLIYFSIFFIMKKIFRPLSLLISDDLDPAVHKKALEIEATGEIAVLISKIQKSQQDKIQLESEKNNFKLATQLAHDIRSPLEVLKGLKDEMTSFPDSSRKRIQLSINRIEEITFNLLKTHKQTVLIDTTHSSEELLSLITSVVTEKNIEFRNHNEIEIIELFDSSSYGLFSKIQRGTLKSILSNLINNGIESLNGTKGIIGVSLVSEDHRNVIKVNDNGPGITEEAKEYLFTKGFTTKKTGHGLGLFNAKQDIEAVGGTIEFDSEVGEGTSFIITLPKSERPSSFIGSIDAFKYERIIVLDDDPAFHEVWNKRLEGLEGKVEHIHSVEEMFSKYQTLHPKILLLSDFELMDKKYDGIDTILKLGHSEHSVLVTARNEEQAIQDRCLAAGIKLLPKSLVNYVKIVKELSESSQAQSGSACMVGDISFGAAGEKYGIYIQGGQAGSSTETPIILIDDDRLVHLNWKTFCKKNQLDFQSFMSIDEFLAESSSFDKASRIYIDSNLGDGIKGEIESEKIFALGFLNLYLATGYEKDSINKPSWIKEIYSKSPENIG